MLHGMMRICSRENGKVPGRKMPAGAFSQYGGRNEAYDFYQRWNLAEGESAHTHDQFRWRTAAGACGS